MENEDRRPKTLIHENEDTKTRCQAFFKVMICFALGFRRKKHETLRRCRKENKGQYVMKHSRSLSCYSVNQRTKTYLILLKRNSDFFFNSLRHVLDNKHGRKCMGCRGFRLKRSSESVISKHCRLCYSCFFFVVTQTNAVICGASLTESCVAVSARIHFAKYSKQCLPRKD